MNDQSGVDGAQRTRCAECGWPLWPGQPTLTVADEERVHERCQGGVPDDLNPRQEDSQP